MAAGYEELNAASYRALDELGTLQSLLRLPAQARSARRVQVATWVA